MTSPLTKVSPTLTPECSNSLQRQGAGAVYLHAHHPDIMRFLDTKRENADEKVRIKTLSLGVVIPDITYELAKKNEDMYLFSPYDIQKVYGVPMSEISVTEKYYEMVDDARIRKSKINARAFFQTIAEIQFESGYPYIMFEDTVNRDNAIKGRINMSNLCQPGYARINTTLGYRRLDDLYNSQENFKVVVDTRARDMNLDSIGTSEETSTKMQLTATQANVFTLTTKEGFQNTATEWHKYYVVRNESLLKIPLKEVVVGDKVLIQSGEGSFGVNSQPQLAYLAGVYAADGTIIRRTDNHVTSSLDLFGDKKAFQSRIEEVAAEVIADVQSGRSNTAPTFLPSADGGIRMYSAGVAKALIQAGLDETRKTAVPEFVFQGDRETVGAYLDGLFSLDGGVYQTSPGSWSFSITSIDTEALRDIQSLLLNFGIYSRIHSVGGSGDSHVQVNPDGTETIWNHSEAVRLIVTDRVSRERLTEIVNFKPSHLRTIQATPVGPIRSARHKNLATVTSVEFAGVEDVYDVTVENGHSVIFDGIATGNCSEILQINTPSTYDESGDYLTVGRDISCNLGSLNIAKAMDSQDLGTIVETAIRALTQVSDLSDIQAVKSIANGNAKSHSVGLGQMNLHGFLAREGIHYGSEEALDFTNIYFYTVNYHTIRASNKIAKEKKEVFEGFKDSTYATGEYFDKYIHEDWGIKTEKVQDMVKRFEFYPPTKQDWAELASQVKTHGLYNMYRQAVAPTGSISYIQHSTSSIHPITSEIEIRKEGKLGRVYYPAPFLTNENREYFTDAYEIGYEKIIDTYAVAQQHIDQGMSLTLFFKDTATTRDINKAQIYAWKKGIKTIYYIRLRQLALDGTGVSECVSCQI